MPNLRKSPQEDLPPLTRAEYRRACLQRSKSFRADLLKHYQRFPPVLARASHRGSAESVPLEPWLQSLFERKSRDLYMGRLGSLKDLKTLDTTVGYLKAARFGWRLLRPEHGSSYFEASGLEEADYQAATQDLRDRWSDVGDLVFQTGHVEDADRPWLLCPSSPFDLEEWQETLSRLGRVAQLVIPIYPTTVQRDIDWKAIQDMKMLVYGRTLPRTHEQKLGFRLQVWDAYQEHRSVAAVARLMQKPPRTIAHHLLVATNDILGVVPKGSIKQNRTVNFDPETHISECARCQKGNLCPAAEAFVDQDTLALRERLSEDPHGGKRNRKKRRSEE